MSMTQKSINYFEVPGIFLDICKALDKAYWRFSSFTVDDVIRPVPKLKSILLEKNPCEKEKSTVFKKIRGSIS